MKIGDYTLECKFNNGVKVGCMFVSREQIEEVLEMLKKAPPYPFPLGTKVKVVRTIEDSGDVLGREGEVVGFDDDQVTVKFLGWRGGWGRHKQKWNVSRRALKLVKK